MENIVIIAEKYDNLEILLQSFSFLITGDHFDKSRIFSQLQNIVTSGNVTSVNNATNENSVTTK